MKIKTIRIQNFRSFKDEIIHFNDYTCLLGSNGAGKSNVLCALNIFFRETTNAVTDLTALDEQDFHQRNTGQPITLTVTFSDLSAEAQEDFKDYYRQGELHITAKAEFDSASRNASVRQYGQRLGMEEFKNYFKKEADGASVSELKSIYADLKSTFVELPAPGTKAQMIDTLHAYEAGHPEKCILIPSEDQFYGFSKGGNRLAKHIQWVFVPAVKHASEEEVEGKNSSLGKLLARTVRKAVNFSDQINVLRDKARSEYVELLEANKSALEGISNSLKQRLQEWANPNTDLSLDWGRDFDKSVQVQEPFAQISAGETGFLGTLGRCGHGLQRSYLLALLQELASGQEEGGPRLILACEEPELYQHPPQERHMASVLRSLANNESQVIICSHSPYFVSGMDFESIRLVQKDRLGNCSQVKAASLDNVSARLAAARGKPPLKPIGIKAKIHQELQPTLNEIFFSPLIVLVEGLEDVAYIKSGLILEQKWDEFRKLGFHIVPAGGKSSMIQPLAILLELGIPCFVVFDSDGHEPDMKKRAKHERDNQIILNLCGLTDQPAMPTDTAWHTSCVVWKSEMGQIVKGDFDPAIFQQIHQTAITECGDGGNLNKNEMYIGCLLAEAYQLGHNPITLKKLCDSIVEFGQAHTTPPGSV